jgi:hypothetical protein
MCPVVALSQSAVKTMHDTPNKLKKQRCNSARQGMCPVVALSQSDVKQCITSQIDTKINVAGQRKGCTSYSLSQSAVKQCIASQINTKINDANQTSDVPSYGQSQSAVKTMHNIPNKCKKATMQARQAMCCLQPVSISINNT